MCPGIAVLAGGGGAGGGSGKGSKGGKGKKKGQTSKKNAKAKGDGKKAKGTQKSKDCKKGGCGSPHTAKSKGDPVDVVTGAVSTLPIVHVDWPGPLPLEFTRRYVSQLCDRDLGFGFGWTHNLAWTIEVRRRSILIHDPDGGTHEVSIVPRDGETVPAPNGWQLHREPWGFVLDLDDGLYHAFSAVHPQSKHYLLTAVEDRSHNRTSLSYDRGALVEIVDSVGRRLHFDGARNGGRVRSIVAAPGGQAAARTVLELTYDTFGDTVVAKDAAGEAWRYQYSDHLLTEQRSRAGVTFHYLYDAQRRCVETWGDLDGRPDPSIAADAPAVLADRRTVARGMFHTRIDFVADGYTEVFDSTGMERFDGSEGGAIGQSAVGSSVTSIEYDDDGHVLAFTDGVGATTEFTRDPRGRMLTATDPLGRVTTAKYDAMGNVVEVLDPKGGRTVDTFDSRGCPESHVAPDGAVTLYVYDARGLMLEEVDPVGARTQIAYDAYGNAAEIVTPTGAVLRRTHDEFGNVTSETDAAGNATQYGYDQLNRRVWAHSPDGATRSYEYDADDRLVRQTYPHGHSVVLTYGVLDDVHTFRDELGRVTTWLYGREGQLAQVINEVGETYRRSWDAAGNVIYEQNFDGSELHYTHDPANRLIACLLENGARVSFEYDAAGQLIHKTLADGDEELYEYDALGDMTAMRRTGQAISFARDAVGRVVEERQTVGDETFSVTTTYDPSGEEIEHRSSLGHRDTMRRDASGNVVERRFNNKRMVQQLDANGRQTRLGIDGIGTVETEYDSAGYLIGRAASDPRGNVLTARRVAHDAMGSVTHISDARRGDVALTHDLIGRLLAFVPPGGGQQQFRFDATSNIERVGEQRVYGAGDRLEQKDATTFEYADDGCMTRRVRVVGSDVEVTEYEWDGDRRLAAVQRPDGARTSFVYDPWGRRLRKTTTTTDGARRDVRFVWDGDVLLHEITTESSAAGARVRTYAFDDDLVTPLAHVDSTANDVASGAVKVYVTDALGTPTALLDGTAANDVEIGPFGESDSRETSLRFPGQFADEETGLVYNRYRYYDPEIARFISADPSGLEGGLNAFVAPWDPYTVSDPDGLRFSDPTKRKATEKARGPDGRVRCQAKGCHVPGGVVVVKGKKSVSKTLPNGKPNPAYKKPPPNEMQFDHKKPRNKGGSDSVRNCQVMCRSCNRKKSDKY